MKDNSVYAIIPVRELEDTKVRLSSFLGPSQRASLTLAMLNHVLSEIEESIVSMAIVVCSKREKELSRLERKFPKLRIIKETHYRGGVNRAFEDGIEYAKRNSFTKINSVMLIPSDLPLLTAHALNYSVAKLAEFDLIISPSIRRDGTNLLLFNCPGGRITFHYDDDSYKKHRDCARARKLKYFILKQNAFSFDVDTRTDYQKLMARLKARTYNGLIEAIGR